MLSTSDNPTHLQSFQLKMGTIVMVRSQVYKRVDFQIPGPVFDRTRNGFCRGYMPHAWKFNSGDSKLDCTLLVDLVDPPENTQSFEPFRLHVV